MDGCESPVAASLRFKLSLWLALAIALIAAGAGVFSFVSALGEAHEMQDNQLRQTGYLISRLDAVPSSPLARERVGDVDFDARVVVRFLRTDSGAPAPMPARPPVFSNLLSDGLQTVTVGRETWRVFVKTNDKGVRVAVGQQTTVRDAAARASALRTLMPILGLVPVLVLLVTVLVRQMFKPLRTLSDELGRRPGHDLGRLSQAGLPSEVWPFVAEINELLARMGRSMASQRRFIADAAHELRSPLTAMSLQAERLGAADMPGEARVRLGALSAGLRRTRVLLDQLLTLARSQEPRRADAEPVSLARAIREVLEDLVPLAEAKHIDLGVIGDADAAVRANMVDLKVLVKNLVDNAIRYTPDGGQVDITVGRSGEAVTMQVEDSGPGIPAEERERVFDPFYRVLGNGEIGSGLGLAIARTVAEGMGARIVLSTAQPPRSGLCARVEFGAAQGAMARARETA
jgi:two-component system, OmpR family, sensor kinase